MGKNRIQDAIETLVGIVTPVQWSEDDQITAVALSATDDEEYLIQNGDKFIDLVQKRIEAKGTVTRNKKSSKCITIKKYHILETYYG